MKKGARHWLNTDTGMSSIFRAEMRFPVSTGVKPAALMTPNTASLASLSSPAT